MLEIAREAREKMQSWSWQAWLFAVASLCCGALPLVSMLPGMYDAGLAKIGEASNVFLLMTWTMIPRASEPAPTRTTFRAFVAFVALMSCAQTVQRFLDDAPRLEFPNNPSFAFHHYQWLTGVALPLAVAALAYLVPDRSLGQTRAEPR